MILFRAALRDRRWERIPQIRGTPRIRHAATRTLTPLDPGLEGEKPGASFAQRALG